MSFSDLQKLANATAEITIQGKTQIIQKLTIREKEEYNKLVNQGLGNIKTNISQRNTDNTQTANLNIEKVSLAQEKANRYLIKQTFKTEKISDDDIDELYEVYDELLSELKRVNHIVEVDNEELEADIKK
jgi:hypothetical protein